MTRKWSWLSGAVGAITVATTMLLAGCRIQGAARWTVSDTAPPPDQYEQPTSGGQGVWVKGHWENHRGRWVWMRGYWQAQVQASAWVDGRWEQRNNQWFWVEGHWSNQGGGTYVDNTTVVTPGADVMWEVDVAPPQPQIEQIPPGRSGYVWVRGAWEYRQGQWQWRTGHYEALQTPTSVWIDGRWENRGNRWVWSPGRWDVSVSGNIEVNTAPPAPQYEPEPAPIAGQIWIKGNWTWSGGRWAWTAGRWQQQQQNRVWVQGKWQNQNNRWLWVEGHWE